MISCLISNEQALVVNLIPKEFLAISFNCLTFSLLNLPLLYFDNKLVSFVEEVFSISSGVGYLSNNSEISNCYTIGNINSLGGGAIAGGTTTELQSISIRNCYYLENIQNGNNGANVQRNWSKD